MSECKREFHIAGDYIENQTNNFYDHSQYNSTGAVMNEKKGKDARAPKPERIARRLYEMTADILMSILLLEDATRAPELFKKSVNVFVRHAEAECAAHHAYIKAFKAEDLENFKA